MAPERRREWKVIFDWDNWSLDNMVENCFLSLVSDNGTQILPNFTWNKGLLGPGGEDFRRIFRALTGQMGNEPRFGILRILRELFICKVLDHLRIMWAPGGAKMTSPLANCFKG